MRDLAENRLDVYRCHSCAAMNVAADSDWCLCTGVERTLMCSKCGRCFCDAPAAWKRDFWRDASTVLIERRKGIVEEILPPQVVEAHPARPVILLIDDDKVVHVVVPRVLAGFHGTLLHAYDGAEGLLMAQTARPDLVITDALLPKIDGRQIAHLLKDSPDTCRTKIVVMTAVYKGAHYKAEAIRKFGVDEFLEKPINAGMFRLIVEKMINVKLPAVPERQERCLMGAL
jgi:CheY-like chemotaxis protein